jgi:hypothetical protein
MAFGVAPTAQALAALGPAAVGTQCETQYDIVHDYLNYLIIYNYPDISVEMSQE